MFTVKVSANHRYASKRGISDLQYVLIWTFISGGGRERDGVITADEAANQLTVIWFFMMI